MNYYVPCLSGTVSVIPPFRPHPFVSACVCFTYILDDERTPTKGKELDLAVLESSTLF